MRNVTAALISHESIVGGQITSDDSRSAEAAQHIGGWTICGGRGEAEVVL